jgi:hypothetical protein
MFRTVRIRGVSCGIIADMVRIMAALAAWTAGTAIATAITWFGANVVLRDAGAGPEMPVVNAAVLPAATPAVSVESPVGPGAPSPGAPPQAGGPARASVSAGVSVSPPSSSASAGPSSLASPSPAGSAHAYTLTGGRVTLAETPTSVQLVTAVPDAGYAVQTWSGTGWLRVDFSSGPQVSSLIASWYEHAPTITIEN